MGFSFLYSLGSPFHPLPENPVLSASDDPLPSEDIGAVRCVLRDPANGHRPLYAISFADVTADSGNVLVFKTGLFKTVYLQSLRLRRYVFDNEYSPDPTTAETGPSSWSFAGPLQDLPVVWDLIGGRNEMIRLGQGIEIRVQRPDFSDASQVVVEDFDYRVIAEGRPSLTIASKRAVASFEEPGILLRGGVVITADDGATLRTNRLRWNPRRGSFTVEGNYLLSRGDSQTAGRMICLDEQLREYQDDTQPISEDQRYVLR